MLTTAEKEQKLLVLHNSLIAKRDEAYKKYQRAIKSDRQDKWWARYRALQKQIGFFRFSELQNNIRSNAGERKYFSAAEWAAIEYQSRIKRKAEAKAKFEKLHRYSPWFMQQRIGADYGTFSCDKCGSTFYHSPSTITRGLTEVYNCCCGHCTNNIIHADYGERPFQ